MRVYKGRCNKGVPTNQLLPRVIGNTDAVRMWIPLGTGVSGCPVHQRLARGCACVSRTGVLRARPFTSSLQASLVTGDMHCGTPMPPGRGKGMCQLYTDANNEPILGREARVIL